MIDKLIKMLMLLNRQLSSHQRSNIYSSNVIMVRSNRLGDYSILVVGCLTVLEAILIATQKGIQRIIIQSDSRFNSINGNIGVPKDIINLVEDLNRLLSRSSENRLEYCNRAIDD